MLLQDMPLIRVCRVMVLLSNGPGKWDSDFQEPGQPQSADNKTETRSVISKDPTAHVEAITDNLNQYAMMKVASTSGVVFNGKTKN